MELCWRLKRDFLSRPFNGQFLCYLSLSLSLSFSPSFSFSLFLYSSIPSLLYSSVLLFLFALSFNSLPCLTCIPLTSTGPVYSVNTSLIRRFLRILDGKKEKTTTTTKKKAGLFVAPVFQLFFNVTI